VTFSAILFLALALAMDATAVAAARGMAATRIRPGDIFKVAVFFGGFQALMPLAGWFIGNGLGPTVEAWDHWIAFALLTGIGARMIWEAYHPEPLEVGSRRELFGLRSMTFLAIATSIDAFAAGIALPLLNAPMLQSILTIGVTTAVLSVVGLYAGRRFGSLLGKRLDIAGGLALIAIGVQILIRDTSGS